MNISSTIRYSIHGRCWIDNILSGKQILRFQPTDRPRASSILGTTKSHESDDKFRSNSGQVGLSRPRSATPVTPRVRQTRRLPGHRTAPLPPTFNPVAFTISRAAEDHTRGVPFPLRPAS